jgi:hypothetical protein
MSDLIKTIHDATTGETIEVAMSAQEIESIATETAKRKEKLETEIAAKEQAKATAHAKLAALGLTVEDLQALGL